MLILLVAIHIIVCIALIMIVLLQTGKGADMGAAFGGGASQTLFGTTGASTFLGKATTVAAIMFMVTCLVLAYVSTGGKGTSSIMKEVPAAQPVVPDTGVQPETAVPADTAGAQSETPVAAGAQSEPAAPIASDTAGAQSEPAAPVASDTAGAQSEPAVPADTGDQPVAEQPVQPE